MTTSTSATPPAAEVRIAASADVDDRAVLGSGSVVWHLAQVRDEAVLGSGCVIGRGAYVGSGVRLGDNVKVQNYGLVHVFHQYTVRIAGGRCDSLQVFLTAQGIGSAVCYPTPVHRLPPFTSLGDGAALPETNAAAAEVLSLPVHPSLSDADLDRIAAAVRSFELGDA